MNFKKLYLANLIIILILCLTNCKSSEKSNKTNISAKIEFSLKTTPCFGICPEFTFIIYSDNTVEYGGLKNTKITGNYKKAFSSEELEKIKSKLIEIDFYTLKLKNNFIVKDLPTKHFYANNGNAENTVLYYYPKNPSLDQLYSLILEFIESASWDVQKSN